MSELQKIGKDKRELARGRNLKVAAYAAPVILTALPAIVTGILFVLFATTPPSAATILFFGFVITLVGFLKGLVLAGIFAYKHSNWSKEMRERIAAGGISADELDWFRNELTSHEKKALKDLERADVMLLDAYRETVASRLTASRIMKSSRREMQLTERRRLKLKGLKSENAQRFREEIEKDKVKIAGIRDEAQDMLIEAESRLQMIEAAALRGGGMADSEMALKKLSARASTLPLALEEAKVAREIVAELEQDEIDKEALPERGQLEGK